MTPKDELIKSIIRLLQYADEDKLKKMDGLEKSWYRNTALRF